MDKKAFAMALALTASVGLFSNAHAVNGLDTDGSCKIQNSVSQGAGDQVTDHLNFQDSNVKKQVLVCHFDISSGFDYTPEQAGSVVAEGFLCEDVANGRTTYNSQAEITKGGKLNMQCHFSQSADTGGGGGWEE